jgi:hypothetical protein
MGEVRPRLVERTDRVALRHRAAAEPRELREHEPHPMARLAPPAELRDGLVVDAGLGVDESFERVRHLQSLRQGPSRHSFGRRGKRPGYRFSDGVLFTASTSTRAALHVIWASAEGEIELVVAEHDRADGEDDEKVRRSSGPL